MKRPLTYTHRDNFDISKRPSNHTLLFTLILSFFMSALPGGVILPLIYTWMVEEPNIQGVTFWAVIGALLGMAVYFPLNLQAGKRKKREFVSAGGDPTGISDHLFGAMGGRKFPDGGWEWSPPGGSGDSI